MRRSLTLTLLFSRSPTLTLKPSLGRGLSLQPNLSLTLTPSLPLHRHRSPLTAHRSPLTHTPHPLQIGTGLITLLGTGTVAGAVYTGAHQGIWQIAATWGGAVALAAYSTAGISGAHLNPAVTLALVAFKGFPVGKALSYAVAQLAGAIAGAMTVLACFGPAIKSFELGKNLVRE